MSVGISPNGACAAPDAQRDATDQVPAIVAAPAPAATVAAIPLGRFLRAAELFRQYGAVPGASSSPDDAGALSRRRAGSCAAVSSPDYPAGWRCQRPAGDFRENHIPGQRPGVAHATALPGIPPARVIAARSSLGISHLRRAPGAPAHFARGKA